MQKTQGRLNRKVEESLRIIDDEKSRFVGMLYNYLLREFQFIMYRLLQCTWGLPQTLAGAIVFILNMGCPHYLYKGAIITKWKSKSSLSLGMFLFISDDPFYHYPEYRRDYDEKTFSKMLMVHEYGHTIQSLIFGPLYLFAVGIPSIAWSFLPTFVRKRANERVSYFSAYPERWANKLGEKVTGELSIGEPV